MFFDYYHEHLAEHYGQRAELCTVHLHTHLLEQVKRHGCLSMTSCFARESYIGDALKICHGKKYVLQQFATWYQIDRLLSTKKESTFESIFHEKHFDEKYIDTSILKCYNDAFLDCCLNFNLTIDKQKSIRFFARYWYGVKTFHSTAYKRNGYAVSFWVSINNRSCPIQAGICFAEIVFFCRMDKNYYAFVKVHQCIRDRFSDSMLTVPIPIELLRRLNAYYHFFYDDKYSYKIIPVDLILHKVIRMIWNQDRVSVFTEVLVDWEHD